MGKNFRVNYPEDRIVEELYNKYYLSDATPDEVISSHWKHEHQRIEIKYSDDCIKLLKDDVFGYLVKSSMKQRMLEWITIISYYLQLPNKISILRLIKKAIPLTKRMGFGFYFNCFRHVYCLDLIMSEVREEEKRINIINIGDGCGFLSALIKEVIPNSSICMIDLGKTLLFQAFYCKRAHPHCSHHLIRDKLPNSVNQQTADFIYCPAEHLNMLKELSFDIAINTASMQEMNASSIRKYFDFLRSNMPPDNLFYCCNREEKKMIGGEITEFLSYPWHEADVHLIDGYSPVHRYHFGRSNNQNGPRIFNFRLPFINYYDGPVRHRLSVIQTWSNLRALDHRPRRTIL